MSRRFVVDMEHLYRVLLSATSAWYTRNEHSIVGAAAPGAQLGNYEQIVKQFMRSIRGVRSQRALARRLGYAANPITDWENGRRVPKVSEAFRAASLVGIDVAAAFARFHPAPLGVSGSTHHFAAWMEAIRGSLRVKEIAARTCLSRFAVGRWINGKAEPRLHDFFRYVDATTGRLYALIAEIVPISTVPAVARRYTQAEAVRAAAQDAPWAEAVLRALELPAYNSREQHQEGILATVLGISVEEEKRALLALHSMGAIRRRKGIYRPTTQVSVDMRGDAVRVNMLLQHWMDAARARIHHRRNHDLFAYSVSSVSQNDAERAAQILREAFREIRSIVKNSAPTERVMLVNLQLMLMDESLTPAPTPHAADGSEDFQ